MAEFQVSGETDIGQKSAEREYSLERGTKFQVSMENDMGNGAKRKAVIQDRSVGKESIPEEILKEMEDVGLSKQEVTSLLSEMELMDENGENCWGEIAEGSDKIAAENTQMEVIDGFQKMIDEVPIQE
jgi:hypothetical protein